MVEHPSVAVEVRRRPGLVDVPVHRPHQPVRRPVDAERVEPVREGVADRVAGADAARARVTGAVDRAVHGVRLEADVLHDVDLAGVRPAAAGAEHPERRPHALPAGHLDAGLEAAVGLGELAGGVEPGGGVLAAAVPAVVVAGVLLARGDDQVALAVVRRVAGAVRVVLPLVVVDVVTGLHVPLGAVHRRAGRCVELVGERGRRYADIRGRGCRVGRGRATHCCQRGEHGRGHGREDHAETGSSRGSRGHLCHRRRSCFVVPSNKGCHGPDHHDKRSRPISGTGSGTGTGTRSVSPPTATRRRGSRRSSPRAIRPSRARCGRSAPRDACPAVRGAVPTPCCARSTAR